MTRKKKKRTRRPSGWIALLTAIAVCYALAHYKHELPVPHALNTLTQQISRPQTSDHQPATVTDGEAQSLARPAPIKGRAETILHHTGYLLSYNTDWKLPNWVAWELTREETSGKMPREDRFAEDPDHVGPQATLADYRGSGYTRGHMVPAADMRWSRQAMEECFYLTNMCPQLAAFNSGNWGQLEQQCRAWAKRDSALIIVCGPIVGRNPKRIGKGGVVVPDGFFKVVLAPYGRTPRAIGFIYPHRNKKGARPQEFMTTVDEVERRTGIDFFPALPDDIERKVEAQQPSLHWRFANERRRKR